MNEKGKKNTHTKSKQKLKRVGVCWEWKHCFATLMMVNRQKKVKEEEGEKKTAWKTLCGNLFNCGQCVCYLMLEKIMLSHVCARLTTDFYDCTQHKKIWQCRSQHVCSCSSPLPDAFTFGHFSLGCEHFFFGFFFQLCSKTLTDCLCTFHSSVLTFYILYRSYVNVTINVLKDNKESEQQRWENSWKMWTRQIDDNRFCNWILELMGFWFDYKPNLCACICRKWFHRE